MNKELRKWEDATEDLVREFLRLYYPEHEYRRNDFVGRCLGDVYFVADMYFGLDYMVEAIRYGATIEQIEEYYYTCTESEERPKVNFKNFIKWGWVIK